MMGSLTAPEQQYKCHNISTLGKPRDKEAKQLLEKIASHVHPIMRQRKWSVGRLREFYPAEEGLLGLNVNAGAEICIRLRPPHDEMQFLDFESLLGTMLHELTHIARGPHDATFYKLLDELTREMETNLVKRFVDGDASGIFQGEGKRVGGRSYGDGHKPNREFVANMAEDRLRRLGTGPQANRLGGKSVPPGISPMEMASRAAERRLLDQIWCGNHETEDTPSIRDRDRDRDSKVRTSPISEPEKVKRLRVSEPDLKNENTANLRKWNCDVCTLVNQPMWLQCGACGTTRIL